MRQILIGLFILLLCLPAHAATNVWLFYGWGDNFLGTSSGINVIARRAQTISGVGSVRVFNYWQTQQVADEANASPPGDKIVLVGYSCGGNAVLSVAWGLNGHRNVYGLTIQPSVWCGRYNLYPNMVYYQETYGLCWMTLGLGCYRPSGPAQKAVFIERPDMHQDADNDPNTQRDVLGAIYAIANPQFAGAQIRHLHQTTYMTRYNGQNVFKLKERQ